MKRLFLLALISLIGLNSNSQNIKKEYISEVTSFGTSTGKTTSQINEKVFITFDEDNHLFTFNFSQRKNKIVEFYFIKQELKEYKGNYLSVYTLAENDLNVISIIGTSVDIYRPYTFVYANNTITTFSSKKNKYK